jgi:hypothetical protein
MKWYKALSLLSLFAVPVTASAQTIEKVPTGKIVQFGDRAPAMWGMSGMQIFTVSAAMGSMTPVMRTALADARTVEILSRTQAPPLRASDIKAVNRNGRHFVVVRRYLLMEVTPADARAERKSEAAVAANWAAGARKVLPQVAPLPNRFGQ